MAAWVEAGHIGELAEGAMKKVTAGGREVLLARISGKVYAADNRCPHLAGNLSRGKLDGTVITCPRHASRFDLRDGMVLRWTNWPAWLLLFARIFKPPRPLKVYNVKIESGSVMIEM